jgi:hypothetical protein
MSSVPITSKTSNLPMVMTNLGGPYQGYSPTQTLNNFKDSEQTNIRRILRSSWQTKYTATSINGKGRITTPYRAVTGLGDYLGRQAYVCGGSNQVNKTFPGRQGPIGSIISRCDGTGIDAKSGNVRYVSDTSDYITYKKQNAINNLYNDLAFGGDESHAEYDPLMRVRRL